MNFARLATIVPSLLFAMTLPQIATAAATILIAPSVEQHHIEARSVCHHYRWSSQRQCTSAKTLQFVARPPLFYPSRYFADRPHYYYEQRRNYWRSVYDRHRWHSWPYRYPYYW